MSNQRTKRGPYGPHVANKAIMHRVELRVRPETVAEVMRRAALENRTVAQMTMKLCGLPLWTPRAQYKTFTDLTRRRERGWRIIAIKLRKHVYEHLKLIALSRGTKPSAHLRHLLEAALWK